MNGPFFNERGIFSLFLHSSQLHPLRAAHLAKPSHRPRYAMRKRTKGTNKPRSLSILYLVHNHCPAAAAQPQKHLRRGRQLRSSFSRRLHRFCRTPRSCLSRARGSATCTSGRSCGCHQTLDSPPRRVYNFTATPDYGLRRSTIIRSLGRFFRVFAPKVGNPQGVCGWLPFTRPSPPPCGWSTGFIATPRTVGRFPCQRVRPAFP